jgi:hypothetical protein
MFSKDKRVREEPQEFLDHEDQLAIVEVKARKERKEPPMATDVKWESFLLQAMESLEAGVIPHITTTTSVGLSRNGFAFLAALEQLHK